jgi:hypothetical protein
MSRHSLGWITCFAAAGCAAIHQSPASTHLVQVPLAVPCGFDVGPEPTWPDSDEALRLAPDLFHRVKLLVAGRVLRIAHENELSAALQACGTLSRPRPETENQSAGDPRYR